MTLVTTDWRWSPWSSGLHV